MDVTLMLSKEGEEESIETGTDCGELLRWASKTSSAIQSRLPQSDFLTSPFPLACVPGVFIRLSS